MVVVGVRTVTYDNPFGQTIVEECSRRELVEEIDECLRDFRDGYIWDDFYAWVEYSDGSYFSIEEGCPHEGRFLKINIKGIIIDECGAEYRVYGNYRMYDDNMNVELV